MACSEISRKHLISLFCLCPRDKASFWLLNFTFNLQTHPLRFQVLPIERPSLSLSLSLFYTYIHIQTSEETRVVSFIIITVTGN